MTQFISRTSIQKKFSLLPSPLISSLYFKHNLEFGGAFKNM